MKHISKSPEDSRKIAEEFIRSIKPGEEAVVVALEGDLGTGKTTFSQFVGEALGIHDPIQSPTFLIEKIYELRRERWQHLIHIDAYRLDDESELLDLGWEGIVARPENIILIEWADRVKSILPRSAYRVVLSHVNEATRQIEIEERETGTS